MEKCKTIQGKKEEGLGNIFCQYCRGSPVIINVLLWAHGQLRISDLDVHFGEPNPNINPYQLDLTFYFKNTFGIGSFHCRKGLSGRRVFKKPQHGANI